MRRIDRKRHEKTREESLSWSQGGGGESRGEKSSSRKSHMTGTSSAMKIRRGSSRSNRSEKDECKEEEAIFSKGV